MKQNVLVVNNILKSVDKLPLEDRILFQKEYKKRAKRDLKNLLNEIGRDNSNYTEEEVMADIEKAVKEVRANRGKKNKSRLRH